MKKGRSSLLALFLSNPLNDLYFPFSFYKNEYKNPLTNMNKGILKELINPFTMPYLEVYISVESGRWVPSVSICIEWNITTKNIANIRKRVMSYN